MVTQPRELPTRRDVAALAGVSTAVVSYVVNEGPRPVAAETRLKVEKAIKQLGYRPNASARALRSGRTNTYGLVVQDPSNTYFGVLIESFRRVLRERDIGMVLGQSGLTGGGREARDLIDRGVDGLIVASSFEDGPDLTKTQAILPVVLVDRAWPVPGANTVGSDYFEGGRLATQHLLDHGFTDIVPIHGPFADDRPSARLLGYLDAIEAAGAIPREPIATRWDREGGYKAGQELLARGELPEAVFALSDGIAIGLLRALADEGIHVPRDLALVSFDSTPEGRYSIPSLTSVKQETEEVARVAVDLLGTPPPAEGNHVQVPVSLDIRESCGCNAP